MDFVQTPAMSGDALTQAWADYVFSDKVDPRIPAVVVDGWRRCKEAGIDPATGGRGSAIDGATFQSIIAENQLLIEVAQPIMGSIYDALSQSRFSLALTDSIGYILKSIGTKDAIRANESCNFVEGTLWSNTSVGTNAVSVALDSDVAIQMIGAEHYCVSHHQGMCSAVPIHNPEGEIVGCLNLSSNDTLPHPHSLGLVIAAAQGIEGKLALRRTGEMMRAALESKKDSIFFLSRDYYPIWANKAACQMLQMEPEELCTKDFRKFCPTLEWSDSLWADKGWNSFNDLRLLIGDKVLRCSAVIYPLIDLGVPVLNVSLSQQKYLIESVNKISGNRAFYTFDDILTQDDSMKRVLMQAQKYARYDGNVLIEGECGTGKELLAQAIHNASSRAGGPFVTVDCASIQHEFREYDLFGYEPDAFPGMSREGNPGRFELANHGTIFLDNITAIPQEFQMQLLRIVESHRVTRVGGKEEIPLDIRIIVSTNHNIKQDVESRQFSSELFYRLNIFYLKIPPLRERRGDIAYCADYIVKRLNALYPNSPHLCSQEFLDGLERYEWPGNTRELQNSLERAFISSPEMTLSAESLRVAFAAGIESPVEQELRQGGSEAGVIRMVLTASDGDVEEAAKRLKMSRATLYRRLKKYNISPRTVRYN